jgi:hypothetical protein
MLIEQQGLGESTICNAMPYIRVEILHASGCVLSKSSG